VTNELHTLLNQHRTLVMGVVNVTPDSFSDGGSHFDCQDAIDYGLRLLDEGAHILDVGGESTAPNSADVDAEEESRRVVPVIEALSKRGAYISADTYKGTTARRAINAGALMINDVTALRGDSELVVVLAESDCDICLMYAKDPTPRTSREQPDYGDVVQYIIEFMSERIDYAASVGIEKNRCVLDPGMGAFISSEPEPSLSVLRRIEEFAFLGRPILVGASRKGFIGQVLDVTVDDRLEGSLACAAVASWNGARIIRVHDVRETVRTVRMVDAIAKESGS
jgi:dihydropteroate synthase